VSYSGTSAWTKLASSGITLPNLAFGDFNGDGRTDAFYANGIKWYVSHNASTAWQQLNTSDIPLSELAFGDFNADGKTDMFYAGFETDLPSVLPHPCDSNSGTLDPACHSDPFSGPGHMTLNTSTSAP
jgi:hypothetical protein